MTESSACSTSAHCIGNGAELIQMGKQDVVFAGGGDVTALWSGGFDTVLPNVTINVNALRK